MGSVTIFDSARMKQIEDTTVVSGEVDAQNHLLLTQRDGTQVDAGSVASNAKMVAEDSATVDVTVGGVGSDADPFRVRADVKKIPASSVDSGVFDLARIPDITVQGLLDPNYFGGSSAQVRIDGQSTLTGPYEWATTYDLQGSRRVRLEKTPTSYRIVGQGPDFEHYLTLKNNWYAYSDGSVDNTFNDQVKATRLRSGLVVLSGLIRTIGAAPTDGQLIATLPPELAPDCSILIPVAMSDQNHVIRIWANGDITCWGNYPGNTYLSLDGVCFFPASANIPWTYVGDSGSSFTSSTETFPTTSAWGRPKYYKDEYGFTWFQGLIQLKTAISTDNTPLINLPASYRSGVDQHFKGSGQPGVHVGLGGHPDVGLKWKPNSPGAVGNYISITGVALTTADALSSNPWNGVSYTANGWGFQPSYVSSFLLREDGLCMGRGLITPGTMAAKAIRLEKQFHPREGRIIFATISNNAFGRIDLSGRHDIESHQPGALRVVNGSAWVSLDTMKWVR